MLLLVSGSTRDVRVHRASPYLGTLLRPGNGNLPTELPWAADNGAFSGFDEGAFETLMERVSAYHGCLWVACPDVVADADATLTLFTAWAPRIRARGLPVALVGQDGLSSEQVPWDEITCFFIGGTTAWKLGGAARSLAREAKAHGKLVHMGRVNSRIRMRYAHAIGCDSVDGTNYSRFGALRIGDALRYIEVLEAQQTLWEAR